jgi:hypothetical protein
LIHFACYTFAVFPVTCQLASTTGKGRRRRFCSALATIAARHGYSDGFRTGACGAEFGGDLPSDGRVVRLNDGEMTWGSDARNVCDGVGRLDGG